MPTITRKRFLGLSCATVAGAAIGAGCAGGEGEGPGGEGTNTNTPTPTPTQTATPTITPTPNPTPTPTPTPFGDCATFGTTTTISNPHMHLMTVTSADVTAGVQKIYDIQGMNATHGHTVTLTAADFTQLQNGFQVVKTSSLTGHTHQVTVRCNDA